MPPDHEIRWPSGTWSAAFPGFRSCVRAKVATLVTTRHRRREDAEQGRPGRKSAVEDPPAGPSARGDQEHGDGAVVATADLERAPGHARRQGQARVPLRHLRHSMRVKRVSGVVGAQCGRATRPGVVSASAVPRSNSNRSHRVASSRHGSTPAGNSPDSARPWKTPTDRSARQGRKESDRGLVEHQRVGTADQGRRRQDARRWPPERSRRGDHDGGQIDAGDGDPRPPPSTPTIAAKWATLARTDRSAYTLGLTGGRRRPGAAVEELPASGRRPPLAPRRSAGHRRWIASRWTYRCRSGPSGHDLAGRDGRKERSGRTGRPPRVTTKALDGHCRRDIHHMLKYSTSARLLKGPHHPGGSLLPWVC